jgi:phospholipid/cholesterol/gamma-HCH transport system substrate-binding protein
LCVQYLAPIVKNRQLNFPPLGENLVVGAQARPNEVTYSEDRLRPDYVPPAPAAPQPDSAVSPGAEAIPTNPDQGLQGMMVLPGGGS